MDAARSRRYHATLDVYALVATYPKEAEALRTVTQLTVLSYLRRKAGKTEVILLLRLAKDLGYVSDDLFAAHVRFFV